jgi:CHAD domain-containing protein/CYTH domain-containing protein
MPQESPAPKLLEEPVERATREVAQRLLEEADKHRRRLGDAKDAEALHDFRVAVRRLRSWLKAYKEPLRGSVSGKHRQGLRAVAHATNPGRDAEVHIEWLRSRKEFFRRGRREGAEWLIERLVAARHAAEEPLQAAVDREFASVRRALTGRLKSYPARVDVAAPGTVFATAMAQRLREQVADLRSGIARVRGPGDRDAAHAARIAAKHVRYLLEPVATEIDEGASMIARLRGLQDVLGALHDAHVFGAEVAQAMVAAGAEQARKLSRTVLDGDPRRRSVRQADQDRVKPGLLAIVQRLRASADESFASFAGAWDGPAAIAFWDEAERAVASLRGRGGSTEEIERKYLLAALPDAVKKTPPLVVEQGYLPGTRLLERLRRVKDRSSTRFFRTVKAGSGLVRTEIEEETTRDVFDRMWPLTKGRRLKKRRHRVADGKLTWEIDDFADRKLVLAEVELPDRHADVEIPKWLRPHVVREVTEEEEYENTNLAR